MLKKLSLLACGIVALGGCARLTGEIISPTLSAPARNATFFLQADASQSATHFSVSSHATPCEGFVPLGWATERWLRPARELAMAATDAQPYRFHIADRDIPLQIRATARHADGSGALQQCEATVRFRAVLSHAYSVQVSPSCEVTLLEASDAQTRWKLRDIETLNCPGPAPAAKTGD